MGEYTIEVVGGYATNYELSYINGTLTIVAPVGVEEIINSGRPFDVYTATGRKVRRQVTSLQGLPKGVYIVEGQKVIVR